MEEFGGELHHAPEPEPEPEPAARFGTRGGRVEIVNETPSLWEGEVDEEANRREFEEALREWRVGGRRGVGDGDDDGDDAGDGGGGGDGDADGDGRGRDAGATEDGAAERRPEGVVIL